MMRRACLVLFAAFALVGFRHLERTPPWGACLISTNNHGGIRNAGTSTGSITATGVSFSGGVATVEVGEECSLAYTSGLTPAGDFTVAAWVNRASGGTAYIGMQSDSGTNNRQWAAFVDSTGNAGLFIWKSGTTSPGNNFSTTGNPVTAGTWIHVACVYDYVTDGTSAGYIYINGVLNSSDTGWVGPVYQSGNQPLLFQRAHPTTGATVQFDDTLLFHRALTATEIRQLYESGRTP